MKTYESKNGERMENEVLFRLSVLYQGARLLQN